MWAAPFLDVRRASREGRLGDLNPTPWAIMLGNCIGWVIYSFLIHNLFVFFGNAFGLILSVWLNLQAVKVLRRTRYFTSHDLVSLVKCSRNFPFV